MIKTLHFAKNWVSMLWSNVLLFFGYKYDKSVIPKGVYCYAPDTEKNNNKPDDDYVFYIIPCPYYKWLGNRRFKGCQFSGRITDDLTFGDQCKICGENYSNEENL